MSTSPEPAIEAPSDCPNDGCAFAECVEHGHCCAVTEHIAPAIEPSFICDSKGCEREAAWGYIGEAGEFYLCDVHALGGMTTAGWHHLPRGLRPT